MSPLAVKERILSRFFDCSRIAGEYEVLAEAAQEGIAGAAAIRGSHVWRDVRPLQSEGLVEQRISHILRQARRRKVYLLTPKRAGSLSVASGHRL